MKPATIKTSGYLISTVSVVLLAAVTWKSARESTPLMLALLAGAASSILGMFLRWYSYEVEKKAKSE